MQTVLLVIIKIYSTLSILGCLYILFRYYYYKSRRDVTMMLVATLAGIDLVIAISKFPATSFIYSKDARNPKNESNYVACQVQGFFMDAAATQAVIWNAVMAFNLLRWVVYRDTQEKLRRRYPWYVISTTLFCILWTGWVALPIHHIKSRHSPDNLEKQSLLGPATFYCWIVDPDFALYHFYIFVFGSLIFIIFVIVKIRSEIRKRASRQLLNHTETALLVIQRQLYLYAISFIVLYIPISIYRIADAVCDTSGEQSTFCRTVVPTFGVFAQTLTNLLGFINAIIFGGFLTFGCKRSARNNADSFLGLVSPSAVMEDNNSSMSLYMPFEHCDHVLVFASTFNMAEGAVPSKPSLASWIPSGRDIYVIGLQECLVLDEVRAAILKHLQAVNGKSYTEYKREIGRRHTKLGYHGFIAISVYVPSSEVESGHFEMHMESSSKVHRGKSLIGMGRASNKGAVGFAFRYFNTTFAVVSCHLASDSSGKSKLLKRHKDSASVLRSLNPLSAVVEFDFQHLVHHTIFMGDLNYRLTSQKASPQDVLEIMANVVNRPYQLAEMHSHTHHYENLTPETSPYLVLTSPGNDTVLLDDISIVEQQHDDTITKIENNTYHSPVKRDNWTPLLQHDELLASLQNGTALTGFSEAIIGFAPTFRRVLGTRLPQDRRVTVAELAAIYSTVVADGGLRVPSYTDRILFHSLPDLHDRIKCLSYSSCEDVITSDHKPVSSTFQVALEKIPRSLEANATLRRCVVTLSNINIQWSSPLETLMTPPSPDMDDEDSPSLTDSPIGVLPTTSIMPPPTFTLFNASSNTTRRGPILVRSIFPLPCEDDFHECRELNELAEQLTLHSDQLESSVYSASKTTTLKQFEATGVKQAALFVPKKHMHIAINFQSSSSNGYSIGQCVLSVMHSYYRHGRKTDFHSVLTSGGRHMGEITGKLSFKVDAV
ncbi:hypothetical protein THRCLA_11553 [Thraustotheca clavata]|uniref:G-protein coupled receptors family 1 profile domain-containing protein n=1 Tax=Thraustotheca clavata TaxID=74557 RepID=A0A1V9Y7G9_9STRA|nr:hypothetical protein THRCLA_11553 [Thraustotheca clavata]